jgi:hypothetical protein
MGRRKRVQTGLCEYFEQEGQIPEFDNEDAVYEFFAPEVFFDVLEEVAPPDEPKTEVTPDPNLKSPAFEEKIIQLAEQGKTNEIIELTRTRLQPGRDGRPTLSDAEKWRNTLYYQAIEIYEQAKFILDDLYPERPTKEINERARMVAAKTLNAVAARGKTVNTDTLRGYIKSSKRVRRS